MSPPEPLTPPPAQSPHTAPPRPSHQHDDCAGAQSATAGRKAGQSESGIRPGTALLQSAQGPAPAAIHQSAARARGRPPPLSGRSRLRIDQFLSHVASSSYLLGVADSVSGRSLEENTEMGGLPERAESAGELAGRRSVSRAAGEGGGTWWVSSAQARAGAQERAFSAGHAFRAAAGAGGLEARAPGLAAGASGSGDAERGSSRCTLGLGLFRGGVSKDGGSRCGQRRLLWTPHSPASAFPTHTAASRHANLILALLSGIGLASKTATQEPCSLAVAACSPAGGFGCCGPLSVEGVEPRGQVEHPAPSLGPRHRFSVLKEQSLNSHCVEQGWLPQGLGRC